MKKNWIFFLIMVTASPVLAYKVYRTDSGTPMRWYVGRVMMVGDRKGTADVPGTAEWQAVTRSMDTWNDVDCDQPRLNFGGLMDDLTIGYNPKGSNQNIIRWVNDKQEWVNRYMGGEEVIAFTTVMYDLKDGAIQDADMELNDWNFDFTVSGVRTKYDVQNTVTHELGHVLGMDHSQYYDATMYYSANKGDLNKRTLEDDDKKGLCYLYGKDWAEKWIESDDSRGETIRSEHESSSSGCTTSRQGSLTILPILLLLLIIMLTQKEL